MEKQENKKRYAYRVGARKGLAAWVVPDGLEVLKAGVAVIHGPQLIDGGEAGEVKRRKGGRGPVRLFKVILGEVVVGGMER